MVTGGARGIGEAIIRRFAAEGATVYLVDLLDGEALVRTCGPAVVYRRMDMADETAWQSLAADLDRAGIVPDILVNNAATFSFEMLEDLDVAQLHRTVELNLIAPCLVLSAMKEAGRLDHQCIVDRWAARCGGDKRLRRDQAGSARHIARVALEVGPWNIRVNDLHPGAIDTLMLNPMQVGRDAPAGHHPGIPLGRFGAPEDVATALLLASDESSYVSGTQLLVDGGIGAGHLLSAAARRARA